MTGTPSIVIRIENQTRNVMIFCREVKRLQHCAKHFLDLNQSWYALEDVDATAHQRLTWRRELADLKCALSLHSFNLCIQYKQCTKHLLAFAGPYVAKIAGVLQESAESGTAVFLGIDALCMFMSSDGVIVFVHSNCSDKKASWNVKTAYIPYDRRYEQATEDIVFERFFVALDRALGKIGRNATCFRMVNPAIWRSYREQLLKWGDDK